jgi:phosphoribosylformimino-5-aminoimidazole carboxamide ribotide isomerase
LELYPAIDIRAGRVVRMSRSDATRQTLYHDDPLAVADGYLAAGARWVHVVDLDRAFGFGEQTALVSAIVKRLPIPVQLGGGLRTADDALRMRDLGVQRVVLGMRAAESVDELTATADLFAEDFLAMSVDVRDGTLWARDWPDAGAVPPLALLQRARAAGLGLGVHTDLSREGSLLGANVEAADALARGSGMPILVSGGIGTLRDLERIRDAGLAGAVVGRALFEGRFTLTDALRWSSPS